MKSEMSMTDGEATKATRREWIGLAVLALGCIVYVMDLTVLHLAVPRLSEDLKPSSTQLLWIIDIYGFLVAGALITMGTLGDRVGRRKLLLIGAAAFSVTSVLAAFSTSSEMLIVSRALMGIAGATLAPSTLSMIFNMFRDPKERSIAIGVWISSFSAGSAIGPVLGGVLLEFFWWGSVFLLALPVMALLLVLGPRLLPEFKDDKAGRLDLLSAGMSLVAVLAVIFGLKEMARNGAGWLPILAIVVGLAVGTLFVRRQLTLDSPLIDVRLFRIPSFSASLATNLLSIFVAVGYFLFIAQYLQLVLELSPLEAGLWSLPSAVAFTISSNLAPRFVYRIRPAYVLSATLTLATVGLGMLLLVGGPNSLAILVVASVVISLAFAPLFSLTTELVVGSAPPERAGAASGIAETASEIGGALGIAILGSIGAAVYRSGLANNLPAGIPSQSAEAALDTLGGAVGVAAQLPGEAGAALLSVARDSFTQGLHIAAAISATIAIVAAGVSIVALRQVPANSQSGDQPKAEAEGPVMIGHFAVEEEGAA